MFFADNDDRLALDALERLSATAIEHRADIVIGRVAGEHGRRIPHMFARDCHGLDAARAPLSLLTPHKLFRRALLDANAIRFPEGECRLEDHLFVTPALFAAERISVLATRPVYYWSWRSGSASSRRPAPDAHFASVRELTALVDARTRPGPLRDRYYLHWYRGKALRRLGRVTGHQADPGYRREIHAAARALIAERFPARLDEQLAFSLRLRAALARRDDARGLERLEAFEARSAHVCGCEGSSRTARV